jgi:flavin reductase (DIM6/NTAB) family NADH-FMN oxidoreductase RutF
MSDAKELLKKIPYPLILLTTCEGETKNGMPISWVAQVSSNPPLVMAAVKEVRFSNRMVSESGRFALVFLGSDQLELISKFKDKDPDKKRKFTGLKIGSAPSGCPILLDALGWLDCKVISAIKPGDHTLFIAEITAAKVLRSGDGLTVSHYGKDYHYGLK